MFRDDINKKIVTNILVIILWLGIWQAASTLTGLDFILSGPVKVFFCLIKLLGKQDTYIIILNSFLKIFTGFILAFLTASSAGIISAGSKLAESILRPPVVVMKSLPVTAFIILVLMIAGSSWVSSVISFIVVFPIVYYGMLESMRNLDLGLNEMSEVFYITGMRRFRFVVLPQCIPYMKTALESSAGMCWKAGVAAEVIGLARYSIGEQMYLSKLYMESDVLLSWGIIIIVVSLAFEKGFLRAVMKTSEELSKYHNAPIFVKKAVQDGTNKTTVKCISKKETAADDSGGIRIKNVSKNYGSDRVLENVSLNIDMNETICLMGESGAGKTTLIRILLGLTSADCGSVGIQGRITAVFQESSLCPWLSAVDNVLIAMKNGSSKRDYVREMLGKVLDEEALDKPVSCLSGGMKRRCEIVRAILCESDAVVMDEPFWGLDENNKMKVAQFILDNIDGRPLLVATHDLEDVKALHAKAFDIDKNGNG